jgi:hypothetical protein
LAKELNVSGYLIVQVLKNRNIKLKSIYEVAKESNYRGRFAQRHYNLNFNYFKTWTNNMAYVLGFIYADGYIGKSKHILRINLKYADHEFLTNIAKELNYEGNVVKYEGNIKDKKYDCCYLSINSLDMIKDLREIGLYENKSLTIEIPKTLPVEYEIDFVRGYFDGDGCVETKRQIHKYKNSDTYQLRTRISSGSYKILASIEDILFRNGLKSKNIKKYKNRNLMDICYSTNESYKIYELFYKNKYCLYLPRKKDIFEKGFYLRSLK